MQHISFIISGFLSTKQKIKKPSKHGLNTLLCKNTHRSYSQFMFEKYLSRKIFSNHHMNFLRKTFKDVAF